MSDTLTVFAIYFGATDWPEGQFVVRAHHTDLQGNTTPDPLAVGVWTLQAARALIPAGLVRLPPLPGEDPVILESWV